MDEPTRSVTASVQESELRRMAERDHEGSLGSLGQLSA